MDVRYVNPFIVATQTVFKSMFNIDMTMDKPVLKHTKVASADVTGVMGLVGDAKGTICMSFRKAGALYLYKTLVGDERDEIGPDIVDCIGELTNITSGQARKELENAGINLKASIPTIIVGSNVELHIMTALPIVSLPFHFSTNGNGTKETVYVDFSFE